MFHALFGEKHALIILYCVQYVSGTAIELIIQKEIIGMQLDEWSSNYMCHRLQWISEYVLILFIQKEICNAMIPCAGDELSVLTAFSTP